MKRFLWKKTTTFLFILIGGTLPLIYYTQFVGVSSEFDRNKFTVRVYAMIYDSC